MIGSEVLVWRIHEEAWTGPHKLISIDGENATIEVNGRTIRFRTTVVKPYVTARRSHTDRQSHTARTSTQH
jgi:hypothetical protein